MKRKKLFQIFSQIDFVFGLFPLALNSEKCTIKYVIKYGTANLSMTQLLWHTFAHLTGSSFRLKAKLLPIKNIFGVKYNRVNSVRK